MPIKQHSTPSSAVPVADRWLEIVQEQVGSLRFGVVQIVVHNARVTQIDRTERLRLDPPTQLSFSNQPDHWRES